MGADRIKFRILIPLTVAIVGLLVAFVAGAFHLKQNALDAQISQYLGSVNKVLQVNNHLELESFEKMLDNLQNHNGLLRAYIAQNDSSFNETVELVFREFSESHDISGLSFYRSDGFVYAVLNDKAYPSSCEHSTLTITMATGRPSYGLELSDGGSLSLSYTVPWQKDEQVIGFIELEKDQNHLLKNVPTAFDVNLVTFIDKSYLERESWERLHRSRRGDLPWDTFADFAVVNNTFDGPLPFTNIKLLSNSSDPADIPAEVLTRGHEYSVAFLPLVDVHSRNVGYTAVFYNAAPFLKKTRNLLGLITALCIIVGIVLFISFHKMLHTLEQKLVESKNKMAEENLLRLEIERRHTRELAAHVLELEVARTRMLNMVREVELARTSAEEALQQPGGTRTGTAQ